MNRYISTIARTEFPTLLALAQVDEQKPGVERPGGFMRPPGVGASNYPHQMELVCNKAFDHEFE
jgi:hypothetical protein